MPTARLPPKPSIEHIKKQAKALVKAYNSADPEACRRVRKHFPRLSNFPEGSVSMPKVSLSDAHWILAKEYGFESWQRLRASILSSSSTQEEAMDATNSTTTDVTSKFYNPIPILNVKSVSASIDYYVSKLGFKKDWEWGDPSDFASVSRNDCKIFLCQGGQGNSGTGMSIFVGNVDVVYKELKDGGAIIRKEPTNYPWGVREMRVEDPDGHTMRIGTGIDHLDKSQLH